MFPDAAPAPVATVTATRLRAPVVELDSGQRIQVEGVLVIGRDPQTPADLPAHLYRWPDLSRTLSKSHARLEAVLRGQEWIPQGS
ncbi:hypothetical protein AB1K54_15950 [Microbacterium sp. BWT-B31]|uniref:hypothetical protein n=1 Tax=Microbacterium sp. BWT-B31 TaxID=3232072 RepID=UPI003529D1A2